MEQEELQENNEQGVQDESVAEGVRDYSNYSVSDLIAELETFCTKESVELHRKEIEEIRSLFYKKQKIEFDTLRQEYLATTGSTEGFTYESKEPQFKDIYGRIKELRSQIAKQREEQQKKNLAVKQEIIQKLATLTEQPESMNKTFADFRALQEEWKNSGEVSPSDDKSIWEQYHLQVAKFYNFVKIDRELRDLDQKKNYEAKVALCEAAEKLSSEKMIVKAFNELQALHEEWKKIGPVKEELKEDLWNRFKTATTVINKAHQDYFTAIKEQEKANLEKKTALCEKIENINKNLDLTQKQWTVATNEMLEIQKEWKTIGFAGQKQSTPVYERYQAACDVFFGARKAFYGDVREVENANKQQKIALCEKAEAMNSRTDWKEATNDFIQLQKDWKKIGATAFRDSQKLWTRFQDACNAFFNAKTDFENQQTKALEDNIPIKEAIIEKVKTISTDVAEDALKMVASIQQEWTKIQVPSSAKADLQNRFSAAIADVMKKLKMDKNDADDLAFRIKMSALKLEKNGEEKLIAEAKHIKNKLASIQNELKTLDNNISFFSKSKGAEKLIASVEKNIEKGKKEIAQLEQKLKTISAILKDNK